MAKIIFFGAEKPLQNLIRYDELNTFVSKDDLILIPEHFAHKYSNVKNMSTYSSKWSQKDIDKFHLYMYLCNFLNRKNPSLSMKLRVRFFGAYKIKSIRFAANAFRSFVNGVKLIDWKILFHLRNKLPEEIILILRDKNYIGEGDLEFFNFFLKQTHYNSIVAFSTFKDPQIIDLSQACFNNNKKLIVFPDCWDNIATAPCLPSYTTHLLVWSEQQIKQIANFFPHLINNAEVIGTYRFNTLKIDSLRDTKENSGGINILYLESSAYENLSITIANLVKLITMANESMNRSTLINLLIRRYPAKKQVEKVQISIEELNKHLIKWDINLKFSENHELINDFAGIDLVFAELTTAGIEAAYFGIPTIFVKSRKSPRYMDMRRYYKFAFSSEIKYFFPIFDLTYSRFNSKNLRILSSYLFPKNFNEIKIVDIQYFGVPLKYESWNTINRSL